MNVNIDSEFCQINQSLKGLYKIFERVKKEIKELVRIAVECATEVSSKIMKIWQNPDIWQVEEKEDKSPLTLADRESHSFITFYLESKTGFPVLSEESSADDSRKSWDELWIVDPLDGTKEFINKIPEFTVNIGFVRKGRPLFGVISAPAKRRIWFSDSDGVFIMNTSTGQVEKIAPKRWDGKTLKIAGSRFHSNEKFDEFVLEVKRSFPGLDVKVDVAGSSLKFCYLAEGEIQVYPRFGKTYEWDTCAGDGICSKAGASITDLEGKKLIYNKDTTVNPFFIGFCPNFPLSDQLFKIARKVAGVL